MTELSKDVRRVLIYRILYFTSRTPYRCYNQILPYELRNACPSNIHTIEIILWNSLQKGSPLKHCFFFLCSLYGNPHMWKVIVIYQVYENRVINRAKLNVLFKVYHRYCKWVAVFWCFSLFKIYCFFLYFRIDCIFESPIKKGVLFQITELEQSSIAVNVFDFTKI